MSCVHAEPILDHFRTVHDPVSLVTVRRVGAGPQREAGRGLRARPASYRRLYLSMKIQVWAHPDVTPSQFRTHYNRLGS